MNGVISSPLHSSIAYLQPTIQSLLTQFPIARKVWELKLQHLVLLQKGFISLCGVKELAVDRVHYNRAEQLLNHPERRLTEQAFQYLYSSHKTNREFYEVHGFMFAGSGVMGIFAVLFKMNTLEAISNGLFTFSNFIALQYHIILIRNSTEQHIRKSAAIGIVSNLGYIISSALITMGPWPTLALIFGILAVCAGSIKIIYDALLLSKTPQKE